jgi:hypothetical protein
MTAVVIKLVAAAVAMRSPASTLLFLFKATLV